MKFQVLFSVFALVISGSAMADSAAPANLNCKASYQVIDLSTGQPQPAVELQSQSAAINANGSAQVEIDATVAGKSYMLIGGDALVKAGSSAASAFTVTILSDDAPAGTFASTIQKLVPGAQLSTSLIMQNSDKQRLRLDFSCSVEAATK